MLFRSKERPRCSRKPKGDVSAGTVTTGGYLKVVVSQKKYYAHQLVFLMQHGYIPELIDHIDGNTANNKIDNLRESSKSLNACNSKLRNSSKSGHKGVTWHKVCKKWAVRVQRNKKGIHLGVFEDFDLACLVADEARILYHGNHAKF